MLLNDQLEKLLLANWTQFLDKLQLMRNVLEYTRNNEYQVILQEEIPPKHTKIQITKFQPTDHDFDVWIEFTVPKEDGVIVGTHTCNLNLNGELALRETYGTFFKVES